MYRIFTRTWWKENPKWPNGLEPEAGTKHTLTTAKTECEARAICKRWNDNHPKDRLSTMAEYDRA